MAAISGTICASNPVASSNSKPLRAPPSVRMRVISSPIRSQEIWPTVGASSREAAQDVFLRGPVPHLTRVPSVQIGPVMAEGRDFERLAVNDDEHDAELRADG